MNRRQFLRSMVATIVATFAVRPHNNFVVGVASANTSIKHTVDIRNFKFEPEVLSVKVGDVVVWTNYDIVPHTATANDDGWDTGNLQTDESAEIVITEASAENYFCRYHPSMVAKLQIES